MHLTSLVLIASAALAFAAENTKQPTHRMGKMPKGKLDNRQFDICKPIKPPYSCAKSCGQGFEACGSFPDCYNPGDGESCCTDGTYCPQGYFCTDAGCCPNSSSLSECGATDIMTGPPPKVPAPSSGGSSSGGDDGDFSPSSSTTSSRLFDSFPTPTDLFPSIPSVPSSDKSTPTGGLYAVVPDSAANAIAVQGGVIAAGLGLLAFL
ncbi:hypothetical protein AJ79_07078 [Helicocarpus griseus UAMH5409]|uniref:Prp 4 CRoW domain-containing protein n=1 Tax=Helicocarpus griseus UAMH5409 TaxID=1447875 RepID=A0A2B7X6Q5_9EURO|nr:hypothetical protein AJ79_07078 [Helicocarpus griseus UAMH5409]